MCKTVQVKDFETIYVYKYNYFSSEVSPGCTAPNLSKVLWPLVTPVCLVRRTCRPLLISCFLHIPDGPGKQVFQLSGDNSWWNPKETIFILFFRKSRRSSDLGYRVRLSRGARFLEKRHFSATFPTSKADCGKLAQRILEKKVPWVLHTLKKDIQR